MGTRVKSGLLAALGFVSDHPWTDVLLGVAVGIGALFLANPVAAVPAGELSALYASAAAVAAVVGGLGSLAVAAYSSGQGARVRQLRRSQGKSLRRNFAAMLGATFMSASVAWSAQVVAYHSTGAAWSLCVGALTLAAGTVLRQTLLFGALLSLSDMDQAARKPSRHSPRMSEARQAARERSGAA